MVFSLINKVKVPKIDDGIKKISNDEDWIHLPDRIGQEDESPSQTEVPKRYRNDTLSLFLRRDPLDNEPHRKHELSKKAEEYPEVELKFRITNGQVL